MAKRAVTDQQPDKRPEMPPHYIADLNVIPNAAFIQDRDGVYRDCNKAFELFLDMPRARFIGKGPRELYPPALVQKCRDEDREVMKAQGTRRFQTSFRLGDGRIIAADIVKTALRDDRGEVAGMLGVVSDAFSGPPVDDFWRKYELLFHYSRDSILLIDPRDGRIIEANQTACDACGYSRQEMRLLRVHDLRVDPPAVVDSRLAAAFKSAVMFETLHRRKDGSAFPVQVEASAARFGDREAVIATIRDMTEVVAAREELRRRNAVLSIMNRMALELINRRDVDEVLGRVITGAAALAGSESALIMLLDPDGAKLTVKAGTGDCAAYVGQAFSARAGMNARILDGGEPLTVNGGEQWPLQGCDPPMERVGAIMGVPLKSAGRVTGIIYFLAAGEAKSSKGYGPELIADFADMASLALENARLYAAAQTEIAERRRVEEALRKSEAMNKSVMDSVHFGLFVLNPEMRIVGANKFMRENFRDADFSLQPFCYEYINGEGAQPCLNCPAREAFRDGALHESVHRLAGKDGEGDRFFRLIAAPIKNDKGAVTSVVEMSEEITGRVLAEEKIRRLSLAVDQSPGLVMITDMDNKITYVNAKFIELTGYTAAEVIGRTPHECVGSGIHSDEYYAEIWRCANAGLEWRGEICNRRKNGELFWALASICPIRNAAGEIAYYLSIQQDITEKKEMEEALRVSRDTLALAAELANLGPWQFRVDKQCFEFSDEFYALYGTDTAHEGRFKTPEEYARDFCHPDDAWLVAREVQKALESPGGYSTRLEHRIIRQDGQVRVIAVRINIVKDADGKPILWYGANQDVTEQKETQRALEERNAELGEALQKLRETQAHLIQHEKMAGVGQLAAGVAHEINNPLSFVVSNFDTLQKYVGRVAEMVAAYRELNARVREEATASLRDLADKIEALERKTKLDYILGDLKPLFAETGEGVGRVANIVKALLLFSRADHQEVFGEYDLNAGIRNTLIVARNELKYAAVVEEELGELPPIEAVGGRVNQVLLNILLNAAQAIASKQAGTPGVIRIRSWRDRDSVFCSIEDNGPGIPEEIHKDIFNPFFTTKPVGQGTGLGLSISYDIVVNGHNGSITVDSAAGSGAKFTIRLPIKQS
jgi:two-component system NtrC family sensor kinase